MRRRRQPCGVEAEIANRLRDGDAASIAADQQIVIQAADQGAAADERQAEPHALLFGERHHFDGNARPAFAKRAHQRDGQHDTQYPIVGARIGYRIDVGTDQQKGSILCASGSRTAQVTGRVQDHGHAGFFHPCAQRAMHVAHGADRGRFA